MRAVITVIGKDNVGIFQNVPGIKDCIIHDVSCSLP